MRYPTSALNRAALIMVLPFALAACGGGRAASGASTGGEDTVVLGSHVPLIGPLAARGKQLNVGADAYFKYINAQGGVNGHKINYIALNDDYDPQKVYTGHGEQVATVLLNWLAQQPTWRAT